VSATNPDNVGACYREAIFKRATCFCFRRRGVVAVEYRRSVYGFTCLPSLLAKQSAKKMLFQNGTMD